MPHTLSHAEAREFYDRFGERQDKQGWYEDAAIANLVTHANFERARRVFEFGCGTGRLAAGLLNDHLSAEARYVGVDVSPTMVELSRSRLAAWEGRAEIRLSEGSVHLEADDGEFDRFVSTYVFDLLSESDIHELLAEAHRMLEANGKLCLAGLTNGTSPVSRTVSSAWKLVHRLRPSLVGGCRPMSVTEFLPPELWRVEHRAVVTAWGLASEVLCAAKC